MQHCSAGARALDTLCVGLMRTSLRQQRAQRFFQQCRTFGSQPSTRQLEATSVAPADSTFTPFHDIEHQPPPSIVYPGKNRRKREKRLLEERDGVTEQSVSPRVESSANEIRQEDGASADNIALPKLHVHLSSPEIEAPSMLETVAVRADQGEAGPIETVVASAGGRKGAQVQSSRRQRGALAKSVGKIGAHTHTDGINGAAEGVSVEKKQPRLHGTRRKAAVASMESGSRTGRKERRVADGTYRASAQARIKNEAVEQQVQTVLYKLDEEVDGPKKAREKAMARLERFKNNTESTKSDMKTDRASAAKGRDAEPKPKKEPWQVQKRALETKFGETGWQPRKRLSPDTLEGIRALHASDPASYSTETLSEHFRVTPEAIRRILKSKWRPDDEEMEDRKDRWERRGVAKWQEMAEQGARPPAKWRAMGVGSEEGPDEEKVPKRRKKKRDDGHLSWDDVVGAEQLEAEGGFEGAIAERLL